MHAHTQPLLPEILLDVRRQALSRYIEQHPVNRLKQQSRIMHVYELNQRVAGRMAHTAHRDRRETA